MNRRVLCSLLGMMVGVCSAWSLPELQILQPDGEASAEYGADVRVDPWDMSQPSDLSHVANIVDTTWSLGRFGGVSATSNPHFHLAVPSGEPIWADRYTIATVRIHVSASTGCAFFWHDEQSQWHCSGWNPLVAGANTVRVDLAAVAPNEWLNDIPLFMLSPANAQGISFWVDEVTLAMAENASDVFQIEWDDGNPPGCTLALYYDLDSLGYDGTLIEAGIDAGNATNVFAWDVTGLPSGQYYVYGDLSDGLTHSLDYSAGSVRRNEPPTMALETPDSTRVAEAEDYASWVWMDPMDMVEDRDIDRVFNATDAGVSDGVWYSDSVGPDVNLRLIGVPIVPLDLHVRGHRPIDTARYVHLSFRMYLSQSGNARVFWYEQLTQPCGQTVFFPAPQGWHTYTVRLDTTALLPPYTTPWQSAPKVGLRLDPTVTASDTLAIDWIRLTRIGDPATLCEIHWEAYDPDDQARIDLYYQGEGPGGQEVIASGLLEQDGPGSYMWDTSTLPPGSYMVVAEISDPYTTVEVEAPGPLLVNHAPLFEFTAPSPVGQDDYATLERGDPWDMSQSTDVAATHQISSWWVSGGVFSAYTSGDDSWVQYPLPEKISARKYHRLSYRMWLQEPQNIGIGSVTKPYYTREDPTGPVTSGGGETILEEDWQTYTYDLATAPLGGEIADTVGWADSIVMFRLDPHEFPWTTLFHIDYVGLRSDDWGDSLFQVRWWDYDPDDDATISLYADTDSSGFDGVLIASGISENSLSDSRMWSTSGVPGGRRYLYALIDDGLNQVRRYALAPMQVNHPPSLLLTNADGVGDQLPSPEDYAANVRGNPWDLSGRNDVFWIQGLSDTSYAGGIFSATITGSPGTVGLDVPNALPIDATYYRILALRMNLSQAGVMHVFWRHKDTGSWDNTNQIQVFEGWRIYRIPVPQFVSAGSSWNGPLDRLQLSLYGIAGEQLQLDWATLTHEGAFADTIRWTDLDAEDDAWISLYFDTDQQGNDGQLIAGGLSENSLVDSYLWDCSFLPPGAYYAYGVIDDEYNGPRISYAPAPFVIGDGVLLPPDLTVAPYGPQSVKLMWDYGGNPPSSVEGFVVYRSDRAYFTPSPANKLMDVTFPFYINYAPEAVGNPNLNYYYRVTARGSGGMESPPSNVAAEFDFACP